MASPTAVKVIGLGLTEARLVAITLTVKEMQQRRNKKGYFNSQINEGGYFEKNKQTESKKSVCGYRFPISLDLECIGQLLTPWEVNSDNDELNIPVRPGQ